MGELEDRVKYSFLLLPFPSRSRLAPDPGGARPYRGARPYPAIILGLVVVLKTTGVWFCRVGWECATVWHVLHSCDGNSSVDAHSVQDMVASATLQKPHAVDREAGEGDGVGTKGKE